MKWWVVITATVCSSCVAPVDEGCLTDEDCRNGRVCEDSSCERAVRTSEPIPPVECELESFEQTRCAALWACERGEERQFYCSGSVRPSDCKCARSEARDLNVDVGADFRCPDRSAMTAFVNDECHWNVQQTQ